MTLMILAFAQTTTDLGSSNFRFRPRTSIFPSTSRALRPSLPITTWSSSCWITRSRAESTSTPPRISLFHHFKVSLISPCSGGRMAEIPGRFTHLGSQETARASCRSPEPSPARRRNLHAKPVEGYHPYCAVHASHSGPPQAVPSPGERVQRPFPGQAEEGPPPRGRVRLQLDLRRVAVDPVYITRAEDDFLAYYHAVRCLTSDPGRPSPHRWRHLAIHPPASLSLGRGAASLTEPSRHLGE